MALTRNRELDRYVDQELRTFAVGAGDVIHKGAIVGMRRSTGFVRPLVAGDEFIGIAYEQADNAGGIDGAISVRVYTQGDFVIDCIGAADALIGGPVYALDDEDTSVVSGTVSSYCGILIHYVSANVGAVRIMPMLAAQIEHAVHIPLVSSTGGATVNLVMITQRPIQIVSADVVFNGKPDAGALDVGTGNTDPTEIVAGFDLTSLSNSVPRPLTLVGQSVAKGQRIWARVGAATTTAGIGGMLSLRFVELP